MINNQYCSDYLKKPMVTWYLAEFYLFYFFLFSTQTQLIQIIKPQMIIRMCLVINHSKAQVPSNFSENVPKTAFSTCFFFEFGHNSVF